MEAMSTKVADIVDEGMRLVAVATAQQVPLRLFGGVAVRVCCPDAVKQPRLSRTLKDIDFAAHKRSKGVLTALFSDQGYVPDEQFNILHGASRLLFYDQQYQRQIDVFLGTFEMCHKLQLESRLAFSGPTLPPSDLLLLKLQIVQLNEKDITDALALLLQYEPVVEDSATTLSCGYIAQLAANQWGWYTTLHDTLAILIERAPNYLEASDVELVRARAATLLAAMQAAPKSLSWRLRDKIGRRMPWYELPEEVDV